METRTISKSKLFLTLAALFLSTMCAMGDMVVIPIVSNLYQVLKNDNLVNAIISGPAIIGVIFCFIGGALVDRINKKTLMIIGFALFTVTSVFGCVIVNGYYMLVCRLIATGVAWGLTSTTALAIISELYPDEVRHGAIVGYYNAAMAAIGAALSFVAGHLAVNGWTLAFKTYWISIPVLLMIIVFVPSMPCKNKKVEKAEKVKGEAGWYKGLIPLLVEVLFVGASYYVIVYMISVYVSDAHIGDVAFSGTLSSIGTVASCLACISFGFVYSKLRKASHIPSFFILGICFFLMAFVPNATVAVISCALMGASWGIFYCFFYSRCSEVVPENMQGTAIGITSSANGIASFFCTYTVTGMKSIMGFTSSLSVWPILGVICLVVGVFAVIEFIKSGKSLDEKHKVQIKEI